MATTRLRALLRTLATATTVSILAGCAASTDQHPATTSTSASPPATTTTAAPRPAPPPVVKDQVEGLVDSVSGNTIRLTQRDRTEAVVDFTPETMVTELTPAHRADLTPGSCVDVQTAPASTPPGGSATAQSVVLDPMVGGTCPPPPGPPRGGTGVVGSVTSVTGNTLVVASTDPTGNRASTTVTLIDATRYSNHAITDPQAVTPGKCLAAQGTNGDGVLHAATIDLEPCPPLGRPHHHLPFHIPPIPHLPHLPHR